MYALTQVVLCVLLKTRFSAAVYSKQTKIQRYGHVHLRFHFHYCEEPHSLQLPTKHKYNNTKRKHDKDRPKPTFQRGDKGS